MADHTDEYAYGMDMNFIHSTYSVILQMVSGWRCVLWLKGCSHSLIRSDTICSAVLMAVVVAGGA